MNKEFEMVLTISPDDLPKGWGLSTISELIAKDGIFTDGDWVISANQDKNGQVRLIQLADIGDGRFIDKSERFLTYEKAIALGCTFLEKSDVLIARMPDPLGRACIFPGVKNKSVTVVDVCIVRPNSKDIDTKWLMYFVNASNFRAAVASFQSGSTRKRISRKNLGRISLPVPPPYEQKLIVAEIEKQFSRLDEAVENLQRVKANLKRYKASVLKAAVEGKLTEQWRAEHPDVEPASRLLERILKERRKKWEENELAKMKAKDKVPKDDKWKKKYIEPLGQNAEDCPELPSGWVWARLEQLGEIIGGLTKNKKRDQYKTRVPYLRVANVYANSLDLSEIKEIGVLEDELDRVLLEKDDLLIVEGNGSRDQIGRVAIWDGSVAPCVHQNHLIKVRLTVPEIGKFLLWWLLSIPGRHHVVDVASSTSGLYTLSISKVGNLPVPVPPIEEQEIITSEVERLMTLATDTDGATEKSIKRTDRLRQSILKKAFSGRLVPSNRDCVSGSADDRSLAAEKMKKCGIPN